MFDLMLTSTGDLTIEADGDVSTTKSITQAVTIRLKWFIGEWRLGPAFGFPYFEEVLVKNPNLTKIKFLLRDLIMTVEGVTGVGSIEIKTDPKTRDAKIAVVFMVGEDTYAEEVKINGLLRTDPERAEYQAAGHHP